MRIALSALNPASQPFRVGRTWCVTVTRKDGVPTEPNTLVTFRTAREAIAFAGGAK